MPKIAVWGRGIAYTTKETVLYLKIADHIIKTIYFKTTLNNS